MNRWVIIVGFTIFFTSSSLATTYIVDPSGGGDATTIQGGLDLAVDSDEVHVLPGTYSENLTMKSGVYLKSTDGPEATIIYGGGGRCINCEQCAVGTRIQGFTLTGGGTYVGGAVRVYDNSDVEIFDNIIRNNHTSYEAAGVDVQLYSFANIHNNQFLQNTTLHSCAISVIVYAHALIQNNFFENNMSSFLSAGIGLDDASADIIGNVFMYNHSTNGASVHAHASSAVVSGNTFLFNYSESGASAVYCYGGSTMDVNNNIFAFNTGAAAANDNGWMNFSCNVFWQNDIEYVGPANPIGAFNNEYVDPLVCAPLSDSASLSEFSPCLNNPTCGTIGANPVPACTSVVPTERATWGLLKITYR